MSAPSPVLDAEGNLHLGPRIIPVPRHLSLEAQQWLAMPRLQPIDYPPLDDKDAWRRFIEERNQATGFFADMMLAQSAGKADVRTEVLAGVTVHIGTPLQLPSAHRQRLQISVHGGALVYMAGRYAMAEAARNAAQSECEAWSVDYRVPPDHPYPAAVDDVIAVYREALKTRHPGDIVMSGASAGGCIVAAALLKARDQGLPLPGALILLTPECDLTESGDTFHVLGQVDNILPRSLPVEIALYANGHDLTHSYLSPLFGDFTPGFPPTLIQSGTRDLFLSNSVRMHRALRNAGIEAELHIWEAAPHGGFPTAPEGREVNRELRCFMDKHLGRR